MSVLVLAHFTLFLGSLGAVLRRLGVILRSFLGLDLLSGLRFS
jgi:hypothetical protein